jgi:hypothetical protein
MGRTDEGDDLGKQIVLIERLRQIGPDASEPGEETIQQTNAPRNDDERKRLELRALFDGEGEPQAVPCVASPDPAQ